MKLSVVIIAKNEEEMIGDCLNSLMDSNGIRIGSNKGSNKFENSEVIVVDTGSTDKTVEIAKKYKARVVKMPWKGYRFSDWRNRGLKEARGDWILYVDADERVTPELQREIESTINNQSRQSRGSSIKRSGQSTISNFSAYEIPRRNFYFGKEMHYGGAWPDYVRRLFLKKNLKKWREKLHEHSEVDGRWGRLESPMIHITHRDLTLMVEKTSDWTKIEAELLYKAGHPPVVWWRIFRMMTTKFFERVIKQSAWRDGTEGWINAIFEVFNTFITYARLWEKQNKR